LRFPEMRQKPKSTMQLANVVSIPDRTDRAASLAVCTFIFVVVPELPGITVGGIKEAVAPGGRFVADIITTLLKGLPVGATSTVISTDPPCITLNGVCGAATV